MLRKKKEAFKKKQPPQDPATSTSGQEKSRQNRTSHKAEHGQDKILNT
jgi:hypothetical protein